LSELEPGMRVIQPDRPDWGVGQVQSVVGNRVTVNFENAGKLLLNLALIRLDPAEG
jgi:FKBP-type peptidyl-prolyl cis-trans isomerase 2